VKIQNIARPLLNKEFAMKRTIPVFFLVGCVFGFFSQCPAAAEGEYVPPDAFVGGLSHPITGR
jgi:hypothetical protein